MILDNKTILVTGGTGSFGKKFTQMILDEYDVKKLIIFSRGELKQAEMKAEFDNHPKLRFFIGNVRDKDRIYRAFDGVDIVIHAAALKRIPECEYNPFEAIKTNVNGAQNVIDAAIDKGVEKVVALSTDKAANPINLYGATKLCSDKLFTAGNAYAGGKKTKFGVVRYGNVMGSRGSVIPFFKKMKETGILPITDPRMTRFWITLEDAVKLVLKALDKMQGGEIFVPKIPSMKVTDLAEAIAPECKQEIVGIRSGEKLHEVMIPRAASRHTIEFEDYYVIEPDYDWWENNNHTGGKKLEKEFEYNSGNNDYWITIDEMRKIINEFN
ncbi:UDP-N-acetylglucosamine 4,6-dehydratase (inverting) [Halanaerobium congolense]|jgi:UDP-N-acetylglucosamine 4,6-dehydratase|uniref:UDP-N-acetylglucosamine 4,6-dehydratase n=1 Tax=Halanaerobium congolense TaxID=54121 RepID=A0A1G6QK04_9FIRM|nr:UDP-N-acetylglucosamine 4,6-dehydratase (inverting) [Halanaerobium congolense]SDC92274.1 UDP-N-acetylglucosamine 4,6-dehydratase [Halanaerobium congolense]